MSDPITLILAANGTVVAVAVGLPEDIHTDADQTAVLRADQAADAWIGWKRDVDGSYLPPGASAASAPVDLLAYASDARWRAEVGGTVWNGCPVATDDRSKTLVTGELSAIDLGARKDGEPFKFADGVFRPLANTELQAVALAMRAHVMRTFVALYGVGAGIQAGSITTTTAVDAALAAAMSAQAA